MGPSSCRIGNFPHFSGYAHHLVETILAEAVPRAVPVELGRALMRRVAKAASANRRYQMFRKGFLADIDALLQHQPDES